jgi:hypothetical protein
MPGTLSHPEHIQFLIPAPPPTQGRARARGGGVPPLGPVGELLGALGDMGVAMLPDGFLVAPGYQPIHVFFCITRP